MMAKQATQKLQAGSEGPKPMTSLSSRPGFWPAFILGSILNIIVFLATLHAAIISDLIWVVWLLLIAYVQYTIRKEGEAAGNYALFTVAVIGAAGFLIGGIVILAVNDNKRAFKYTIPILIGIAFLTALVGAILIP